MRITMTKLLFISAICVLSFATATASFAADTSHDTSADSKESKEKSISTKGSTDKKDSESTRKSRTKSKGKEKTKSTSKRESGTLGKNASLDLSISGRSLFTNDVRYKLPVDLGLSAQHKNGVIDLLRQDWIRHCAAANATVTEADANEAALRTYLGEVARMGATIGQALIYLQQDIPLIGKMQKTKTGEIEITGLGANDLQLLAAGAFKRAEAKISDLRILSQLSAITSNTEACRLVGGVEQNMRIQCGQATITLSSPPDLVYQGTPWYGSNGYSGISASYRVSSSWSWSQALEAAKTDSQFARYATEASDSSEHMESEGKSLEAAMTRRQAVDWMRANKTNMGAGKFMPSVHQ